MASPCGGPSDFLSAWVFLSLKHPARNRARPNTQRWRHSFGKLAQYARDAATR